MQLILAIDSDPRRSEQLANLVRSRLQVDLVQATSAGEALHALRDRVPDLILTSPLLSPFDDGVLDEYLRDLGSAATHVQTLRIPMLSTGPRKKSAAGRLFALGRKQKQTSPAAPDGCDPKIFADEITHYLTRSLEDRTASAQAVADQMPQRDPEPAYEPAYARAGQSADEWGAPEALVEEFRAPIHQAPQPVESVAFEDRHVPGSILDLRAPIVHAPVKRAVVEPEPETYESPTYVTPEPTYVTPEPTYMTPEPTYMTPEPTYVVPEPSFVTPEPTFVMPEPTYVTPEPEYVTPAPAYVRPEPTYVRPEPAYVRPEPTYVKPVEPEPISIVEPARASERPTPAATTSGNSASFEAALAAIRAAWAKPEQKQTSPATPAPSVRPAAGSSDVDLTNAVDALEDIGDGRQDSPDGKNARHKAEKPRKRPEKPGARKTRGADGRDEWGVFDPNQREFSTLVNKLDEVTDSDEPTTRTTPVRRL